MIKRIKNYKFINKVTYCYVDIDNFTNFNIANCYELGDKIINDIFKLIESIITFKKLIKQESDEFVFICFGNFDYNKIHFLNLMECIQYKYNITISISVLELNSEFITYETIFDKLKFGLQYAKYHGKNKLYIEK